MELLIPGDVKDLHLKTLLDVVFDESKKRLAALREQLKDDPVALSKRQREFIVKECAKLSSLGSMQRRLDEYREKHSRTTPGHKAKEASSTNGGKVLGEHLRAVGQFGYGPSWHPHHIVCSRHSSHASARFALFAFFGINDPHNGCWLPSNRKYATGTPLPNAVGHAFLHTNKYAVWVATMISNSADKQDMARRLNNLRIKLHDATNLPDILTEKGKEDMRARY